MGLPWWLSGKESACHAGDPDSIPGLGRSLGGWHGNPPQYSCLENPVDRGAWYTTVHRVAQSRTQLKQLSSIRSSVYIISQCFPGDPVSKESACNAGDPS